MRKDFIIPVIFLAAIIFAGYVLWPQYQKVQYLEEEIAQQEEQLIQAQAASLRFTQDLEDLVNHQEAVAKIEAALPEQISLPDLFSFFQQRTAESGLALEGLSFGEQGSIAQEEGASPSNVQAAYFSLDVIGFYSSLKSFLEVLESSARLIEVESITIGGDEEAAGTEAEIPVGFLRSSISVKLHSH